MAETLKFGNLTMASKTTTVEFLRIAGLFVALMLVQIVQSLDAQAHVRCAKIDELQKYNDPEIATRIEQHYGSKEFFAATLSNRFYVVRLGPANCGHPTCLHRLVQVTDGTVQSD